MGLIAMSRLGFMGRWGNELIQYMFLRTYAQKYDLPYECCPWTGQYVFGLVDPPITEKLPSWNENRPWHIHRWTGAPPEGKECIGRDVRGYFQFHMSYYKPYQKEIAQWFQCQGEVLERLQPALSRFSQARTCIGLHFRRGDTGRVNYYLTPVAWYLQWLEKHWDRFDDPVLYIATEEAGLEKAFAKYNPLIPERLGVELTKDEVPQYQYLRQDLQDPTPVAMDFLPDWVFLTKCHVVLMPNSTFSFTAAMISPDLQELWRSRLSTQKFERIEPWDCTPLTYEHLDDYPGIPDTQYDSNHYWQKGFKPKHPSA